MIYRILISESLLKYSRLERVAFQLYTLRGKYYPSGIRRVLTLHPKGSKLPRREYITSFVNLDVLEHIANFKSNPAYLKVATLECVTSFCILTSFLIICPYPTY
jgi:hypothetical protein